MKSEPAKLASNRENLMETEQVYRHHRRTWQVTHQGQRTDEARGEKEKSMNASEWAKRNGPGEEQAKEENEGIKRRV
jgi:hypothetical protein